MVTTTVAFPIARFHPAGALPQDGYAAVKAEGFEVDELRDLLRGWNFRRAAAT
jgi:hypothetical protein